MTTRFAAPSFLFAAVLLLTHTASGSAATAGLLPETTIPIVFSRSVSAQSAHPGDVVEARTTQVLRLANGAIVHRGALVHGHVVASSSFVYDHTPYARQTPASLSIAFDSIELGTVAVPLHVTVRAVASPIATWAASTPEDSDKDPLGTVQQVGGDRLTRSQTEVVNSAGDVVGYQHKDGVYAHLIPNGRCDGGSVEVPVGIFSASACGLYGFGDVAAKEMGSNAAPSRMTLVSTHTSPKLWKNTSALLEVLPEPAR